MAADPIAPGGYWDPLNWFGDAVNTAGSWLSGLGGQVASGIEGGFVGLIKDLQGVLLPWFLIGLGLLIIAFAFTVYFKGETIGAAGSLLKAGAV